MTDTILEILKGHLSNSCVPAYHLIDSKGSLVESISFSSIYESAKSKSEYISSICSRGDRVAISMPQNVLYIEAILACMIAGVICVPTPDIANRKDEVRAKKIFMDADVSLVLVQRDILSSELQSDGNFRIVNFDNVAEMEKHLASVASVDEINVTENTVALLQYTSGSTSSPKGVVISHGNIIANVYELAVAGNCHSEDVFVNWLPLYHDMGLINVVFLPIFLGANSFVMDPKVFIARPMKWLESISKFRGTVCGAPNFAYDWCVDKGQLSTAVDLSCWRLAFNASEKISKDTMCRFLARYRANGLSESCVFSAYGLAESTAFVTGQFLSPHELHSEAQYVPVGNGSSLNIIEILDDEGEPVTQEECVGEIHIAGPSVSAGYWRDLRCGLEGAIEIKPRLGFIETGDLALRKNGALAIVGRKADVVKLRGKQIYLEDLEQLITAMRFSIRSDTVAVCRDDGDNFVAFIEQKKSERYETTLGQMLEEIRVELQRSAGITLSEIVCVKRGGISRTTSNKKSRAKTVERYRAGQLRNRVIFVSQAKKVADSIALVMRSFIVYYESGDRGKQDLSEIQVYDSIELIELLDRIFKHYSVDVETSEFGYIKTFEDIARLIDKKSSPSIVSSVLSGVNAKTIANDIIPLNSAQLSLWKLIYSSRDLGSFNELIIHSIPSSVDCDRLIASIESVVNKFCILRAPIINRNEQLGFDTREMSPIRVAKIYGKSEESYDHHIKSIKAKRISITDNCLFRVYLVDCGDKRQLIFHSHHIVLDGWSIKFILRELLEKYNENDSAIVHDREMVYPSLDKYDQEVSKKTVDFWRHKLRRFLVSENLRRLDSQCIAKSYEALNLVLDQETTDNIDLCLPKLQVTPIVFFGSTVFLALRNIFGSGDYLISLPTHGRSTNIQRREVGMFVTKAYLSESINEHVDSMTLIESISQQIKEIQKQQFFPFEKVLSALNQEGLFLSESSPPIGINYEDFTFQNLYLGDRPLVVRREHDASTPRSGINLTVSRCNLGDSTRYQLQWAVDERITKEISAADIQEAFKCALNQLLTDATENREVSFRHEISLSSDGASIIDAIYQSVMKCPNNLALKDRYNSISYASLWQSASIVGLHMRQEKVKTIGILTEYTCESVVIMLGALLSGTTYVPLDFRLPHSRLKKIIDHSEMTRIYSCERSLDRWRVLATELGIDIVNTNEILKSAPNVCADLLVSWAEYQPCYLLYTSGSTGSPKGVMQSTRSLLFNAKSYAASINLTFETQLLMVSSLSFDASVMDIYGALISGSTIHMYPIHEMGFSGIRQYINDRKINILHFTPTIFREIYESSALSPPEKFVTYLVFGGESVSISDLETAKKNFNGECILINGYGPTETTVALQKRYRLAEYTDEKCISIGTPLPGVDVYIDNVSPEDENATPVGEIIIKSPGVALGYWNSPILSSSRFSPTADRKRKYRTNDLGYINKQGDIVYVGRKDFMVKINGKFINLTEVENALETLRSQIKAVALDVWIGKRRRIVAFIEQKTENYCLTEVEIRQLMRQTVDESLIPYRIFQCTAIPLTNTGKKCRDREFYEALLTEKFPSTERPVFGSKSDEIESKLKDIWSEILGTEVSDMNLGFFDAGGDSVQAIRYFDRLRSIFSVKRDYTCVYEFPTIKSMSEFLRLSTEGDSGDESAKMHENPEDIGDFDLAIIGFSADVPGAESLEAFFDNLMKRKDLINNPGEDGIQLDEAGRRYVDRSLAVKDMSLFDNDLFGVSEMDATLMCPQQRLLLEHSYILLQNAGYGNIKSSQDIGVFLASSPSKYFFDEITNNTQIVSRFGTNHLWGLNSRPAMRVSNKLNLTGPSMNIDTACSSSLVAVIEAMQSVRSGACEMAIAGGVSITKMGDEGYFPEQGGILSDDGYCRPFDISRSGTTFSNGCGLVLIKNFKKAIADGDRITAIICSAAVNNDGSQKVSYNAPNIEQQTRVVYAGLKGAGKKLDNLRYIEAHATGTKVGDDIELQAITTALEQLNVHRRVYLGSVKGNIGHLDVASGIMGVIKCLLMIENGVQVPEMNFEQGSEFLHASRMQIEKSQTLELPKNALFGINSFGFGGTNANLCLQAFQRDCTNEVKNGHAFLIPVSARTDVLLEQLVEEIYRFCETQPDLSLGELARTFQEGRVAHDHRTFFVASGVEDLKRLAQLHLSKSTGSRLPESTGTDVPRSFSVDMSLSTAVMVYDYITNSNWNLLLQRSLSETHSLLENLCTPYFDKSTDKSAHIKRICLYRVFADLKSVFPYELTISDVNTDFVIALASRHQSQYARVILWLLGQCSDIFTKNCGPEELKNSVGNFCKNIPSTYASPFVISEMSRISEIIFCQNSELSEQQLNILLLESECAFEEGIMANSGYRIGASLSNIFCRDGKVDEFGFVNNFLHAIGNLWVEQFNVDFKMWGMDRDFAFNRFPTEPMNRKSFWIGRASNEPICDRMLSKGLIKSPVLKKIEQNLLMQSPLNNDSVRYIIFCEFEQVAHLSSVFEKLGLTPYFFCAGKNNFRINDQVYIYNEQNDIKFHLKEISATKTRFISLYIRTSEPGCDSNELGDYTEIFSYERCLDFCKVASLYYEVAPHRSSLILITRQPLQGEAAVEPQLWADLTVKVLSQEKQLNCLIHISLDQNLDSLAIKKIHEIESSGLSHRSFKLIEGSAFVEDYVAMKCPMPQDKATKDVVVVVGGTGDIGKAIVEHLSNYIPNNIVITGTKRIEDVPSWGSIKLADLASSEICNSRTPPVGRIVFYSKLDISIETETIEFYQMIRSKFSGRLRILNLAGCKSEIGTPIVQSLLSPSPTWRTKVIGTKNLITCAPDSYISRFVSMSSISTLLGGVGHFKYAFANHCQAVFGRQIAYKREQISYINIFSDAWQSEEKESRKLGMSEASEVVSRLLFNSVGGDCILSKRDISEEYDKWYVRPEESDENSVCAEIRLGSSGATVLDLFRQFLGDSYIDEEDDFFESGGDSLLAIRLLAAINKTFHVDIDFDTFFDKSTAAAISEQLAVSIEKRQRTSEGEKSSSCKVSYASFAQRRIWIAHQYSGGQNYRIDSFYRIQGQLIKRLLEEAINVVLDRHDIFRTRFSFINGELMQEVIVNPKRAFTLQERYIDAKESHCNILKVIQSISATSSADFDLEHGRTYYISLYNVNDEYYVLHVAMHHIITDWWSKEILLGELTHVYESLCLGLPSTLSNLQSSYAEYANNQITKFNDGGYKESLQYWKRELESARLFHGLVDQSMTRRAGNVETHAYQINISGDRINLINNRCSDFKLTRFAFIQSIVGLLIAMETGEDHVILGGANSGRLEKGQSDVIGCYINPFLIKTTLERTESIIEFFLEVNRSVKAALIHSSLPFDLLVKEIDIEFNPDINPIFQILVSSRSGAVPYKKAHEIVLQEFQIINSLSKFDIDLDIVARDDELALNWRFRKDIFNASFAKRFMTKFELLLNAFTDPNLDFHKDIYQFSQNAISRSVALGACPMHQGLSDFIEMFCDSVHRQPDAIAVRDGRRNFTFLELSQAVSLCAIGLINKMEKTGPIGVMLPRSFELVVVILAAAKLGLPYIPLDINCPIGRLEHILAESGMVLLVSDVPSLSESTLNASVESFSALIGKAHENPHTVIPRLTRGNDRLSYIIFTSGSTGLPKGVKVSNGSLSNFLTFAKDEFLAPEISGSVVCTSIGFDATVGSLHLALAAGIASVLLPEDDSIIHTLLQCLLAESENYLFKLTPTHLDAALEIVGKDCTSSARHILVIAGEKLSPSLVLRWATILPNARFINEYGPTEATVGATTFDINISKVSPLHKSVEIGIPIWNTHLAVLDENKNIVPHNVEGELYIAGAGLAHGYLGNESLTAEKFVDLSFDGTSQTFYKTGDLVVMDAEKCLSYLNRIDDQIKLNGQRVELSEIERVCESIPFVSKAVVTTTAESVIEAHIRVDRDHLFSVIRRIENDTVGKWSDVHNESYKEIKPGHDLDFTGWNSSYTGEAIPVPEMVLWRDNTLQRILSLNPKNLVEIGFGSGLLLSGYMEKCQSILGFEISIRAIESAREKYRDWNDRLTLLTITDSSYEILKVRPYDTVVLNSVCQYFPNEKYFADLLQILVTDLEIDGHIFIGDVRNLDTFNLHETLKIVSRAGFNPISSADVREQIVGISQETGELLLSPSFFLDFVAQNTALSIDILPKKEVVCNEMSLFRYDVIIRKCNVPVRQTEPEYWIDRLEDLGKISGSPACFGLSGVPNPRIQSIVEFYKAAVDGSDVYIDVDGLKNDCMPYDSQSLDDILRFANERNYQYEYTISLSKGECFDVIFYKGSKPDIKPRQMAARPRNANIPNLNIVGESIVIETSKYLYRHLPSYMVPSYIKLVEDFPVTINGKIDKGRLRRNHPAPKKQRSEPSNSVEQAMRSIWCDVFKLESIGIDDNFHELGGDSIKAIFIAAKAKERGFNIELRDILEKRTIRDICVTLTSQAADKSIPEYDGFLAL